MLFKEFEKLVKSNDFDPHYQRIDDPKVFNKTMSTTEKVYSLSKVIYRNNPELLNKMLKLFKQKGSDFSPKPTSIKNSGNGFVVILIGSETKGILTSYKTAKDAKGIKVNNIFTKISDANDHKNKMNKMLGKSELKYVVAKVKNGVIMSELQEMKTFKEFLVSEGKKSSINDLKKALKKNPDLTLDLSNEDDFASEIEIDGKTIMGTDRDGGEIQFSIEDVVRINN